MAAGLRLSTRAGIKLYTLREQSGPAGDAGQTTAVPAKRYVFDSELGQPKFDSASIPMLTREPRERVIDYDIDVDGESFPITALQMGNPNCCIFVNDFEAIDWRKIGRAIETHEQFPDRTNVVFVRVEDRNTIELRIWERGVGETEASGTCSCAAAVAAMINGKTERLVNVLMPGGKAKIHWRDGIDGGDNGEVVITGSAEVIYDGDWLAQTG
jgi:diaminopimelate epimerase